MSISSATAEKHQAQKLAVDLDKEYIWNTAEKRTSAKVAFVDTNNTLLQSCVSQLLHKETPVGCRGGKKQGLIFKWNPQ